MLGRDLFKIENNTDISSERFKSLVLFYCPLITTDALSLYEYLLVKGSTASFEEISAVLNALMMPLDDFEKSLKKLNEYKLLFTYAYDEDGKYLFSLRNPKTRDEFIHDEILVRDFILKTSGDYYNSLIVDIPQSNMSYSLKDITCRYDLESLSGWTSENETYLNVKRNEYNFDSFFDVRSFLSDMSSTLFPLRFRSEDNLKEIARLADLYGISEDKMRTFISKVIRSESDGIDLKYLRYLCENSKTEYKKVPENSYDVPCELFLMSKQDGLSVSSYDKKLLYNLSHDYGLRPDVINVLIEHALKVCDNHLIEKYLYSAASDLRRNHVDSVDKARESLNKENRRTSSRKEVGIPEYVSTNESQVDLSEIYKRLKNGNK